MCAQLPAAESRRKIDKLKKAVDNCKKQFNNENDYIGLMYFFDGSM